MLAGLIAAGGLFLGYRHGFERGMEWMLDSPLSALTPYTNEELDTPAEFNLWDFEMAVRNNVNKMNGETVYVRDVYSQMDVLQIYGSSIIHPGVPVSVTKDHIEQGITEYWTDNGLPIYDRGTIDSLDDVTMMRNLKTLILYSQTISDLSPLTGLKLESLYLGNNYVGNLMPIKEMVTLKELDIGLNPVANLAPVSNLLSLEKLELYQTQISDLSALKNLTKLRQLDLSYCDATDFEVLKKLGKLRKLTMQGLSVKDYSFLESLDKLISLDVAQSGISDLSVLPEIPPLECLQLPGNPITDITAIDQFGSLKELFLGHTKIEDVSALAEMTKLEKLSLSNTNVQDISALAKLPVLRELNISHTLVNDLTPFIGRESMITITCTGIDEEVLKQIDGAENIVLVRE